VLYYTHINSKKGKAKGKKNSSLKKENTIALGITSNTPYSSEVLMVF